MAKILKGVGKATLVFLVVGVALPYGLDYLAPTLSRYVTLPPSQDRWPVFITFGVLFAITSFLQNAYVKGEYPWLFGKLGRGVITLAFYSYLLLFLPSFSASQSFRVTGLIALVYLTIILSYLYLVLDFFDARRARSQEGKKGEPSSVQPTRE